MFPQQLLHKVETLFMSEALVFCWRCCCFFSSLFIHKLKKKKNCLIFEQNKGVFNPLIAKGNRSYSSCLSHAFSVCSSEITSSDEMEGLRVSLCFADTVFVLHRDAAGVLELLDLIRCWWSIIRMKIQAILLGVSLILTYTGNPQYVEWDRLEENEAMQRFRRLESATRETQSVH